MKKNKTVKRDHHLHIRLNEREFETIKKYADKLNMKKSEFGREAIRRYIREIEYPVKETLTNNHIKAVATTAIKETSIDRQQLLEDLDKRISETIKKQIRKSITEKDIDKAIRDETLNNLLKSPLFKIDVKTGKIIKKGDNKNE